MNIKIHPGKDRNDHFYAIKDAGTGNYLGADWKDDNGREVCTWYGLDHKVCKIAGNEARARSRMQAVIDMMVNERMLVSTHNPPSRWRGENLKILDRLMNGDLVLVRIEIDLKVAETLV